MSYYSADRFSNYREITAKFDSEGPCGRPPGTACGTAPIDATASTDACFPKERKTAPDRQRGRPAEVEAGRKTTLAWVL